MDDDDHKSLNVIEKCDGSLLKLFIGPRLRGYATLNLLYTELAKAATGDWIWIMNDDATVEGKDWDLKLKEIPTDGWIVQPEFIQNGMSLYQKCVGGPFPLIPRDSWSKWGATTIPDPADTQLDELLRVHHNWGTKFLEGITVNHQRDNDEQLEAHRKL